MKIIEKIFQCPRIFTQTCADTKLSSVIYLSEWAYLNARKSYICWKNYILGSKHTVKNILLSHAFDPRLVFGFIYNSDFVSSIFCVSTLNPSISNP